VIETAPVGRRHKRAAPIANSLLAYRDKRRPRSDGDREAGQDGPNDGEESGRCGNGPRDLAKAFNDNGLADLDVHIH
jgi:hypothetical protein